MKGKSIIIVFLLLFMNGCMVNRKTTITSEDITGNQEYRQLLEASKEKLDSASTLTSKEVLTMNVNGVELSYELTNDIQFEPFIIKSNFITNINNLSSYNTIYYAEIENEFYQYTTINIYQNQYLLQEPFTNIYKNQESIIFLMLSYYPIQSLNQKSLYENDKEYIEYSFNLNLNI